MRYKQAQKHPKARRLGILGAELRAPPPARPSLAVSLLHARIA
jgi:hypothetical protein